MDVENKSVFHNHRRVKRFSLRRGLGGDGLRRQSAEDDVRLVVEQTSERRSGSLRFRHPSVLSADIFHDGGIEPE